MDAADVRRLAMDLPEVIEEPHFEYASFRIRGRIFVTLPPDGEYAHVFVEPEEARAVAAAEGGAVEELWWGKRLSGLRVRLAGADPTLVAALVDAAWRRKAPKRLVAGR